MKKFIKIIEQYKGSLSGELYKDLFYYGFFTGLSYLTNIVLLPIIAYKIDIVEYGTLEILTLLSNFTAVLISLSLPSSISRLFFDKYNNSLDKSLLVSTSLIFIFLIGIVFSLLIWIFSTDISTLLTNEKKFNLLIFISFLNGFLIALCSIPKMVLRINRNIFKFILINLIYSLSLFFVILFSLFVLDGGFKSIILSIFIVSIFQLAICLFSIKEYLTIDFNLTFLKSSLSYSLPLFPAVIVGIVNEQADRIILLKILGLTAVGIYSASAKISMIIKFLTMIFRNAWEPYALSLLQINEIGRNKFYYSVQTVFLAITSWFTILIYSYSPEIIAYLLPQEYSEGALLLPWICGSAFLHASASVSNIGILVQKKTIYNTISATIGAGTNIIFTISLIPIFGLKGAALGTFIAELMFTSLLMYFTYKISRIQFDYIKITQILLLFILNSLVFLTIVNYCHNQFYSLAFRTIILAISSLCLFSLVIKKKQVKILFTEKN